MIFLFYPTVHADEMIDGNTILVSAQNVANPVAVRYGWAKTPIVNLCKKQDLTASPFKTDQ